MRRIGRHFKRLRELAEEHGHETPYHLLRAWYSGGDSIRQIANVVECSHETIRHYLKLYQIPLRRRTADPHSLYGADIQGTIKAVSQQTGIPMSTIYRRRQRLAKQQEQKEGVNEL